MDTPVTLRWGFLKIVSSLTRWWRSKQARGVRLDAPARWGANAATIVQPLQAQASAKIAFDGATRAFRLDGADTTYVLGINQSGELQSLYWGKRLSDADHFAAVKAMPGHASFDMPVTTTPQEFTGWGGGLYVEPDLKVTFPDGNRDLVLNCVSHTIEANEVAIVMKEHLA